MLYLVDAYAWVEYFIGSKRGEKVRDLIHSPRNQSITLAPCLGEVRGWSLKEKQDFQKIQYVLRSNSVIEEVYADDWIKAAEIRHETRKTTPDFGFIDAVLLAKQRQHHCKILTGDKHFKTLKNVEYIWK